MAPVWFAARFALSAHCSNKRCLPGARGVGSVVTAVLAQRVTPRGVTTAESALAAPGQGARAIHPGGGRCGRGLVLPGGRGRGETGDECSELGVVRCTPDHPDVRRHLRPVVPVARFGHSGMFPCFLGGRPALLVRSARSARTICSRVSDGRITAST